ncbi:MAG: hypothetical protein ACJ786_36890 [Catenulispora sp.]
MRISRRASRTTAAGLVLALGALTATACSSSSSSGGSTPAAQGQTQSPAAANENDIQILNSLQLTASELDTAFATDGKWHAWADADMSKLLIKQAQACTKGMIDTTLKSLQPVTTAFKADTLPSDSLVSPTSTSGPSGSSSPSSTKSSSGHKGNSGSPSSSSSSSGSSSGAPGDGNPAHWVVSTAIAYQSAGAAKSAVGGMGTVDPATAANCGGPAGTDPTIGGGIGEVGPTWDNSQGVFVFVDTRSTTSVAIVAQRRGRYVVLTYTRGSAVKLPSGYYDLESGPDTNRAADAATTALAQLTDAIVNR